MKRKHDHIGDLSNYNWDKEECIREVSQYPENFKINYTALANKYEVKNKQMVKVRNGGQVIKQFLIKNDVDTRKFCELSQSNSQI